MTFGEKFKARRKALGLTQEQAAIRAETTARSIQNYESGSTDPSFSVLGKLAVAVETTPDYFYDDTEIAALQFLEKTQEEHGTRGRKQATKLLQQAQALFSGGSLDEETQQLFQNAMTEIFNDAKERNKKHSQKKDQRERNV